MSSAVKGIFTSAIANHVDRYFCRRVPENGKAWIFLCGIVVRLAFDKDANFPGFISFAKDGITDADLMRFTNIFELAGATVPSGSVITPKLHAHNQLG